jgi:uncharacterized OsmC-like protein
MDRPTTGFVAERQDPLCAGYRKRPEEARIVDRARASSSGCDPVHGRTIPGSRDYGVEWAFGIHRAVGGDHDAPNPGDILCAALAACLDATLRMIADRLGVRLLSLDVEVTAEVDVRGTLLVSREVPVGFQRMTCDVSLEAEEGTDPRLLGKLQAAAEFSCVNLQTLQTGVPVTTRFSVTGNA